MADLPQYPLPNPGLPLGQQAVSPVAQTNPLMSMGQGINTGATLGLQAGQLALEAKQRQAQLYQAQIEAQKNEENFLTTAWQRIADLKAIPDYQNHLINQVEPLMGQVLARHGLQVDLAHQDFTTNDKVKNQVIGVMSSAMPMTEKVTALQKIKLANPGLEDINKQISDIENSTIKQSDHQDELAQQWVTNNQSLRGDTVYKQLETQRNAAGQGYDTLRKYQKPDGSFNLSNGQIVDLYGQLWKAQTGGVLSPAELDEMNQASLQKNYARLTGLANMSSNALPTEVGKRLLTMFSNLGDFSEKQHASMESSKAAKPGGLTDPTKIESAQAALGRGLTFHQMKAQSDAEYQANTQKNFSSDVLSYAKQHGITPQQAQQIKIRRGGK